MVRDTPRPPEVCHGILRGPEHHEGYKASSVQGCEGGCVVAWGASSLQGQYTEFPACEVSRVEDMRKQHS